MATEVSRQNNLNLVRLIAAMLVLYGHSFVFLGLEHPKFLGWVTLGPLGVYIFFTISGYLIVESWCHDPHLGRFFMRRILRILPGLIVCILLTIFVLGPVITTVSLSEYFSSVQTWHYLRNIVLYINYSLPGVFEANRLPNAVNGSLWSLPVEFTMYIIVAGIGFVSKNRWVWLGIAIASALGTVFWAQRTTEVLVVYGFDLRQVFICGTYFWCGVVFNVFNVKRMFSITSVVLAMVLMLCFTSNNQWLVSSSWALLPFVVLSFGLSNSPLISKLTYSGDYSYGIYIYAFPIQQLVVMLYPDMAITTYLVTCTTITFLLAIASWHLVEQRALRLKPRKQALKT